MTKLHKELITCPECFHDEDVTVWDVISVKEDPDLKDEILRKKIQTFYCNNCQAEYVLDRGFIYIDEEAELFLYYCPSLRPLFENKNFQEVFNLSAEFLQDLSEESRKLILSKNWRSRMCLTYNDLIEKIHLFDHNFDDRLMEIVKLAIKSRLASDEDKHAEALHFLNADDTHMLFQFLDSNGEWERLDLDISLYLNAENELKNKLPFLQGLLRIDEAFALNFLEKYK